MEFDFVQASFPDQVMLENMTRDLQVCDYIVRVYTDNNNGIIHTVGLSRKMGVEFFLNMHVSDPKYAVDTLNKIMASIMHGCGYDGTKLKEGTLDDVMVFNVEDQNNEKAKGMPIYLMKVEPELIPIVAPIMPMFTSPEYVAYQVVLPNVEGKFPWESKSPYLGPDETYASQYIIRPPMKLLN